MKTKFLNYLLLLALFISACGKDGDIGPQGEKGEQGPKGEQGIPGKDGSTILSGTSNPNTSIGKEGDFYLNLKTGDLFGPKSSTAWGDPYNMKGTKGDTGNDGSDGKDGAAILNGKTAPTKDQGKPGDFYINTSDYTIFGPKKENGDWGNPVSLKSNEENGVTYFYIYPQFDDVISQTNNNFDVNTKWYTIPDVNDKYMHLSYLLGFRLDNTPRNISINWKDLYVENVLPSYIALDLETALKDTKLTVSGGEIDVIDGSGYLRFNLKGSVDGTAPNPSIPIPLVIPNFIIKIQVYHMKDGGVIAKKTSDIERYLRINKMVNESID